MNKNESIYANLEGFAWDQPKVYETDNRPDPRYCAPPPNVSPTVEDLEIVEIKAKEAFKVFQNFSHEGANFLEHIGYKPFKRNTDEYNRPIKRKEETLFRSYLRIQDECSELITELEKIESDNGETYDFGEKVDSKKMIKELKDLQNDLKSKAKLNEDIDQDITKSNIVIPENLIKTKYKTFDRLTLLSRRINHLEKFFSEDENKLGFLNFYTKENDIMGYLKVLRTKLSQFDLDSLENLNLQVTSCLEGITKQQKVHIRPKETLDKSKLKSLYIMASKSEKNMEELAQITSKLNMNSKLEEEICYVAENFGSANKLLELAKRNTDSIEDELKMLRESLNANLNELNSYINKVDNRIKLINPDV